MQRLARELNLAETVFVLPPTGRRRRQGPDLYPGHRTSLRGASRPRYGVRGRGRPGHQRRDPGDGRGPGAHRPGTRRRPDRVRPDEAAHPDLGAVQAGRRTARRAGCRRVSAAGRAVPQRPGARLRRAGQRGQSPRSAGPGGPRGPGGGRELLRGRGRSWKTRMFYPSVGVPEARPPARPRARWPSTWPVTAGSGSASRSRSARARRSAAVGAIREGQRQGRQDRFGRGRRLGPDRGRGPAPGRVGQA